VKRKIAILWHQHQPHYRNPHSGKIELPWVRLHGLKDYYGMVAILKDFPKFKATYNLVPSLLMQLECYLKGEKDIYQELFIKDAGLLTTEEVAFLVRHFFSANYPNLIKPFPRYRFLYEKQKQYKATVNNSSDWIHVFTTNELRDLQVWYPLCHFDETYKSDDSRVKALIKKGTHFSEADKRVVQEVEMELLGKIIPVHKEFADRGQIEISTTPFYHPILPLLLDPQQGRVANPSLPEYDLHFHWKDDAVFQLEQALTYMEKIFGHKPAGIWPSEGSLSREVLEIMAEMGVRWTATDEANLSKSLDIPMHRDHDFILQNPDVLYKPYVLETPGKDNGKTKIFFRDRHLSDLIGFHYRKMPYKKAAADLVDRIKRIPSTSNSDMVVPIILDGENAWEYFHNSGRDFLAEFFQRVSDDDSLETVTFSEVLDMEPGKIRNYSPGSWINGNFDIWIGDEEDRKGWQLLAKTRAAIEEVKDFLPVEKIQEVKELLSIAQGSDWFWWFGKENYTPDLDIFDNLFRKNMQKIFEILGKDVPMEFYLPVSTASAAKGARVDITTPSAPLKPYIDGQINSYLEWLCAGRLEAAAFGGAMNIATPLATTLYYGFDPMHLYLRIDTEKKALDYFNEDYSLEIIIKKKRKQFILKVKPGKNHLPIPKPGELPFQSAIDRVIECAVPLLPLKLGIGDAFQLSLQWKRNGQPFQAIPPQDYFPLSVPTAKDYAHTWQV
jgi:alpha-amylase/alpha-mannosidase (GH57 family)